MVEQQKKELAARKAREKYEKELAEDRRLEKEERALAESEKLEGGRWEDQDEQIDAELESESHI